MCEFHVGEPVRWIRGDREVYWVVGRIPVIGGEGYSYSICRERSGKGPIVSICNDGRKGFAPVWIERGVRVMDRNGAESEVLIALWSKSEEQVHVVLVGGVRLSLTAFLDRYRPNYPTRFERGIAV